MSSRTDEIRAWLDNNRGVVGLTLLALTLTWTLDFLPSIAVPLWARVLASFAIAGGPAGYLLANFWDLETDEVDWKVLKQVDASNLDSIPDYELNPKAWEQLDVVGGDLKHLPDHEDPTYLCWRYDDVHNIAYVTWHGVPQDAELVGTAPSSIENRIAAMREDYEEPVRWGEAISDGIRPIIRSIEFRRMERQNAALDPHLTPTMGDDDLDQMIRNAIPDDALPDDLLDDADDGDRDAGNVGDVSIANDVDDAIEPVDTPTEAATDGGTDE